MALYPHPQAPPAFSMLHSEELKQREWPGDEANGTCMLFSHLSSVSSSPRPGDAPFINHQRELITSSYHGYLLSVEVTVNLLWLSLYRYEEKENGQE